MATVKPAATAAASDQGCGCEKQAFMAVPEAAKRLGSCSREYLYAGLREERFPGARFGRSWALPTSFIEGFIADVLEAGRTTRLEDYAVQWRARQNSTGTNTPETTAVTDTA